MDFDSNRPSCCKAEIRSAEQVAIRLMRGHSVEDIRSDDEDELGPKASSAERHGRRSLQTEAGGEAKQERFMRGAGACPQT